MSTPIDPTNRPGARFVELDGTTDLPPSPATTGPSEAGVAQDGFDPPDDAPPVYLQSGPAPPPPPSPGPAQTLPTAPQEPPPNPLTQQPPPPPAPPPSKIPELPNPHPYVERTPGGFIAGIKGKF